jgi:hypothetical protein
MTFVGGRADKVFGKMAPPLEYLGVMVPDRHWAIQGLETYSGIDESEMIAEK